MADDEEPVAYLGGAAGSPAKAPPAKEDEEVSGYLGGSEGELPALPPQESTGSYTANDFIKPEEQPAEADPYADPYAQPGAEEAPADQYGEYDASGQAAEGDASYFDSMAHSGEGGPAVDEGAPADEGYADDTNDDPDQPKTISQQDAESIIRRITTKRILPPEQEGKKPQIAPPPRLTEAGGGMKVWPIIFVIFVLGGVGVYLFGEQIAETFPGLREYMPWLPPKEVPKEIDLQPVEDPAVKAKRELLEMITRSEAKAFGVKPADVAPLKKAPVPGAAPAPGTPDSTEKK
jgi:hypothetical protein